MGGEFVPGFNDTRCADFLFRQKNMIVEMKMLDQQARNEHALKMEARVSTWMRRELFAIHDRERMAVPMSCQKPVSAQHRNEIPRLQPVDSESSIL